MEQLDTDHLTTKLSPKHTNMISGTLYRPYSSLAVQTYFLNYSILHKKESKKIMICLSRQNNKNKVKWKAEKQMF